MDFYIEVESLPAQYAGAEQAAAAPEFQDSIQVIEQIAVFAAQIEHAFARADGEGAQRHALEYQVRLGGEQDAIVEGPGFAFVGIADHVVRLALGFAAGLPFQAGGEAGAATSAQIRRLELSNQPLRAARERRGERIAGREFAAEQNVLAPHLVLDAEVFARPVGERDLVADQFAD